MEFRTKLIIWLVISLLISLPFYGFIEYRLSKERVESDLTSKGEAMVMAAAKGLQAIIEDHINNGVMLPSGINVSGKELENLLFDDELILIPESKVLAEKRYTTNDKIKRFDGTEILMSQYEYKYMSKADLYTDSYWQRFIDAFMGDPDIVFAVPTKYSSDPAKNGWISTHNTLYSQITPIESRDQWGDSGILSQNNRANRVFNDFAGGAATSNINTTKPLKTIYERKINGLTITMWDMSYPIFIDGRHWGAFRLSISKENADRLITLRLKETIWRMSIFALVLLLILSGFILFFI